jgi:hypothetical protein
MILAEGCDEGTGGNVCHKASLLTILIQCGWDGRQLAPSLARIHTAFVAFARVCVFESCGLKAGRRGTTTDWRLPSSVADRAAESGANYASTGSRRRWVLEVVCA